jgi:hypothetical protein
MNTISISNAEIKVLWPTIYEDIQREVKEPVGAGEPFEKRVREILKKHLGTELIRTNSEYTKFFHDALRFAVNMQTDKILHKIEAGRSKYGEARHSKGRIRNTD